jgi:hypothetical protein
LELFKRNKGKAERIDLRYNIFLNGAKYEVYSSPPFYAYRHGDGGEWGYSAILEKEGKPLLVSLSLRREDTLSDDSEDYSRGNIDRTYLLEDDILAREVFNSLKTYDSNKK